MPTNLKKFGDELRAARKAKKLTQRGLAEKLKDAGVEYSDKYISVLEKATRHEDKHAPRQPDPDLVKALARELNQSVYRWLDLTGHEVNNGIVFEDEFYQDLSAEQLDKISHILQRERNRRRKQSHVEVTAGSK